MKLVIKGKVPDNNPTLLIAVPTKAFVPEEQLAEEFDKYTQEELENWLKGHGIPENQVAHIVNEIASYSQFYSAIYAKLPTIENGTLTLEAPPVCYLLRIFPTMPSTKQ